MVFIVSHDIVVKRTSGTKTVQEKRKLKRTVNMLDVSSRVLSNFVGRRTPNSPMSIPSRFPGSMRGIYSSACLLRGVIEKMMEGLEESGGQTLHRNVEECLDDDEQDQNMSVRFESISIADLLRSKTRQG